SMLAVGNGTTCDAGNTSRSHDHLGNVNNGGSSSWYCRSHVRSAALPAIDDASTRASPAENHTVAPPAGGVAGSGPKRSARAGPSTGKIAAQPWAYGSPSTGATVS